MKAPTNQHFGAKLYIFFLGISLTEEIFLIWVRQKLVKITKAWANNKEIVPSHGYDFDQIFPSEGNPIEDPVIGTPKPKSWLKSMLVNDFLTWLPTGWQLWKKS